MKELSCISNVRIAIFVSFALFFAGCSSIDGPDLPPSFRLDYETEYAVPSNADTVLVLIGTRVSTGALVPFEVFVDTAPSEDGLLRFDLRIVGESYDQADRAVIESRWSGDTLRVWCGVSQPRSWQFETGMEKTSPTISWFSPKRVDIAGPEGAQFRYLGQWYE